MHFAKRFAFAAIFLRFARSISRHLWLLLSIALLLPGAQSKAIAQNQFYGGVLTGVSTLSADQGSKFQASGTFALSLYNPANGLLLGAVFGREVSEHVSLQGNYIWNRNRLTLASTVFTNGTLTAYQELRKSSQHSALVDVLVYFRSKDSRLRPYLSVGTGLVHFSSSEQIVTHSTGNPALPPTSFSSNLIALHVPVGMDVKLRKNWMFRYSFSETLTKNPVSDHLSPPGQHKMMNFQHSFVILRRF